MFYQPFICHARFWILLVKSFIKNSWAIKFRRWCIPSWFHFQSFKICIIKLLFKEFFRSIFTAELELLGPLLIFCLPLTLRLWGFFLWVQSMYHVNINLIEFKSSLLEQFYFLFRISKLWAKDFPFPASFTSAYGLNLNLWLINMYLIYIKVFFVF